MLLLDQVVIATLFPLMLAAVALLIRAYIKARIRFGGYIRDAHPDRWRDLVPDALRGALQFSSLDATRAMEQFRKASSDDLGDPEVALRRESANSSERLAYRSVALFFGWGLVVAVTLAVRAVL